MPNIVKYNLSTSPNSIQSGNFNIGVNNTETDLSEFYTGICPIEEGYTIYIDKASNGPSIYAPKDDAELVEITNVLGGNVSTPEDALVWITSQSNMTVLNTNYPPIVTSGVTLNLDSACVSSYPTTGINWNDLSGNGYYGVFSGGFSYNRKFYGTLQFEGGYVENIGSNSSFEFIQNTGVFTICAMVRFAPPGATPPGIFGVMATSRNEPVENGFKMGRDSNNRLLFIISNGSGYIIYNSISDYFVNDEWIFITIVGDGTNVLYYKNGEYLETNSYEDNFATGESARKLTVGDGGYDNVWLGNISHTLIYNRALDDREIKQNYNAILQRFIEVGSLELSLDAQNTNLYANSTTTAYDISRNTFTGLLSSAQQYVADGNGSWSFNGGDFISNIGNLISFDFIQNTAIFTICVWVKLTDFSTNKLITIIGNNSRRTNEKGFQLSRGDARRSIRFSMTDGSNYIYDEQIDDYFSLDEWVFITIVGDGTNISYYQNGTLFSPIIGTISTVSSLISTLCS